MAKLAIDSASLEYLAINWEVFIPNREIGRLLLLYQKSEDLPPNRETWKHGLRAIYAVRGLQS